MLFVFAKFELAAENTISKEGASEHMDTETFSEITILASLINLACIPISIFTIIEIWSLCITIGFFIMIAHGVVISMLSDEKKLLVGTTNEHAMDSIDKALKRNKILLVINAVAFIIFSCFNTLFNMMLSA